MNSIIQAQGIHHITLNGADKKTSIDFWQNILGMKFIFEQPNLDDLNTNHLYLDGYFQSPLYFKKIAEHVKCHVETYQRKAYRTAHTITVTECWGAHYTKTDRAIKHSHYPALWSGVAYIQSPNKSSPTVFPECKYSHAPEEGTYIIFPGWLKHYVENGSGDRYVCAFNMRALNIKDARRKKNSAN